MKTNRKKEKKIEYRIIKFSDADSDVKLEEWLNRIGNQGWKLVNTHYEKFRDFENDKSYVFEKITKD